MQLHGPFLLPTLPARYCEKRSDVAIFDRKVGDMHIEDCHAHSQ